jgi:sugar lactone lactonase YvrE
MSSVLSSRGLRMKSPKLIGAVPLLVFALAIIAFSGCKRVRPLDAIPGHKEEAAMGQRAPRGTRPESRLIEVAASDRQWTGVAVSREGRIFVCYPRWSDKVTFSVGEILESGEVVPYPDEEWNSWDELAPPDESFVCVQSVYVDADDNLWILDPANPLFGGVVPGGPKLLKVDLSDGKITRRILFDETVAPVSSYLNDVRVDTERNVAYMTDSGLGAIIVVDLGSGKSRRLLAGHHSTKSESIVLTIGGSKWLIGGQAPKVHSDGLALTADGEYLYYQALTGRTLYRIRTRWLRDASLSERQVQAKVESMYETGAADGIEFGPDGYLYLTAIEYDAIRVFVSLGTPETVVEDPRLRWPDSIARGPDGYLYVTTSQIHLGGSVKEPYRIFRFRPFW